MQQLIKTETFLGIDKCDRWYLLYVTINFLGKLSKLNTKYLPLEDADCECMMWSQYMDWLLETLNASNLFLRVYPFYSFWLNKCLLSNYSQSQCCMLHSTASLCDCHIESFSATLWCCECEQCFCARCCPSAPPSQGKTHFTCGHSYCDTRNNVASNCFFCIHFKNYPYTIPVSYKQQGIYLMKPLHNNLKCASKCCIFPYYWLRKQPYKS